MGQCPHKSPSPCNTCHTCVIIHIDVLICHKNTHTHRHRHTHTHAHSQTHTHTCTRTRTLTHSLTHTHTHTHTHTTVRVNTVSWSLLASEERADLSSVYSGNHAAHSCANTRVSGFGAHVCVCVCLCVRRWCRRWITCCVWRRWSRGRT